MIIRAIKLHFDLATLANLSGHSPKPWLADRYLPPGASPAKAKQALSKHYAIVWYMSDWKYLWGSTSGRVSMPSLGLRKCRTSRSQIGSPGADLSAEIGAIRRTGTSSPFSAHCFDMRLFQFNSYLYRSNNTNVKEAKRPHVACHLGWLGIQPTVLLFYPDIISGRCLNVPCGIRQCLI